MLNQTRRFTRIDNDGEQDVTEQVEKLRSALEQALDSLIALTGQHDLGSMPPLTQSKGVLVVGEQALDVRLPRGQVVSLSRRGPARRLLVALIEQHRRAPGVALSVSDAFFAGWPNERAQPEAAASRVYTTVRILRNLGFRPWLISRDDGYMLATELEIQAVGELLSEPPEVEGV